MKPVSPPLSSTKLNRFFYALTLFTALLGAYYSYRIVQWKTDVGGWWNLATGVRPQQVRNSAFTQSKAAEAAQRSEKGNGGAHPVEDRLNALAEALGMPSKDLAAAIAVAVREYVPPASLSSIAAQETGPAVVAMIKGVGYDNVKIEPAVTEADPLQATGVITGVMSGFVGMDEP